MIWYEVLGINETKDTKKIRKVYSQLLKEFSPEKNPEKFQEIREAYEKGIKFARELTKEVITSKEVVDPVGEFMKEVLENYIAYEKRINIEVWKTLLDRDVCYNIESSKVVSYRLLEFIMDHYYFPSYVYKLFNSYFSWDSQLRELSGTFNIYVLNYINKEIFDEDIINYEYLLKGKKGEEDRFIHSFKEVCTLVGENNYEAAKVYIDICNEICPNHPNINLILGRICIFKEEYNEAIDIFNKYIHLYPNDENPYFYRGQAFYKVNKISDSIKDMEKVLELNPNFDEAYYWIALMNGICGVFGKAFKMVDELKKKSYSREYMESLNKGVFLYYLDVMKKDKDYINPPSPGAAYWIARSLYETKDYIACINFSLMAIKKGLLSTSIYYMYCRSLLKVNREEEVLSLAFKLLEKNKHDYKLFFVYGDALQAVGRYEESLNEYKKALEISSEDADLFNACAYSFYKLKDYENAIACSNNAINLNNKNGYYYINKINSLIELNYFSEAYYESEYALEKDETCPALYNVQMNILYNVGNAEEALELYEDIVSKNYDVKELQDIRLSCLLSLGRFEEINEKIYSKRKKDAYFNFQVGVEYYNRENYSMALLYLKYAKKYDKYFRDAYIYMAKIYEEINNRKLRISVLEEACKLKLPNAWEFYCLVGEAWCEVPVVDKALNNLNIALKLKPDYPEALVSRGCAYYESKKLNLAYKDIERALEIEPDFPLALGLLLLIYKSEDEKEKLDDLCEYIKEKNMDVDLEEYLK